MPATKIRLFAKSADSREHHVKVPRVLTLVPFHAKSRNETPITIERKTRMKAPRFGSDAKAWTDVSTPERTRNIPRSESEKVRIARNTVQILKTPRFCVTAIECMSAVPVSQGIRDEFSTGSQAHQPPQPSS